MMTMVMTIRKLLDKYDDYHELFQILNKEDISLHKNRDSIREVIIIKNFIITTNITNIIIITIIMSMISR